MAVVGTAEELAVGRESRIGQNGVREYHRVFKVLTDDADDDANVVTSASGLPVMYENYLTDTSEDATSLVVDIVPRQHEKHRNFWHVHVAYSTQWDRIDDPFTEPPLIHWGSEIFQEPLPGQVNSLIGSLSDPSSDLTSETPRNNQAFINWGAGKGIVNSAGHPYNPPPERQSSRPIVTVTRNESSFNTAYKVLYENTVNNATWCGLYPRQAWLRSIEADTLVWRSTQFGVEDIYYFRVTYTFALKWETWDLQILDYGPFYLNWTGNGLAAIPPETPTLTDFQTASGSPRMGLLDNSDPNKPGRKLAAGEDPQWRRYLIYREQSFSGLNINLNLSLQNLKTRVRA